MTRWTQTPDLEGNTGRTMRTVLAAARASREYGANVLVVAPPAALKPAIFYLLERAGADMTKIIIETVDRIDRVMLPIATHTFWEHHAIDLYEKRQIDQVTARADRLRAESGSLKPS